MTGRTDIALLRFLRERTDETAILNDSAAAAAVVTGDLPARLVEAARRLRAVASGDDGCTIAYGILAEHPAYAALRALTGQLAAFDPAGLSRREEKLAFWINVFNTLAVEAVLRFGLRTSIREAPGFFRRAAYCIGGRRFSAEAIEHGILRGNRPPLPRLEPPFAPGDPRLALTVSPLDPRVHCALNCAARSCPPLRVYAPAQIDAELDAAAEGFLRGGGVSFTAERTSVSAIFAFFADDFGGRAATAAWICRYLDDPAERRRVYDAFRDGNDPFQPYDWALNAAAGTAGRPGV